MSARYSTNKVLPKEIVEQMRGKFRKCCVYLETENRPQDEDEAERKAKETMLMIAGFTGEEIEKGSLLAMSADELEKVVRERLIGQSNGEVGRQIVAGKDKMESLIGEGWEFVALVENKVILKLPDQR